MSDTLERELRRTLAERAPSAPSGTDPWQRVQAGVVRRRRQRAGAVAGSLALVVAAGVGVAVVQPWAGGEPTQPATEEVVEVPAAWAALDDGRPRGDLGQDATVLADAAALLRDQPVHDDGRPLVEGSARLLFAGDVGGSRVVVAAGDYGQDGDAQPRWSAMVGPAGADVADLLVAGQGSVGPQTAPAVVVTVGGDEPGLLAVVPRGGQVSVSDAASVGADGTATRTWRPVEVEDGVAVTTLTSADGYGTAVLRLDSAPALPTGQPLVEQAVRWPSAGPTPADAQAAAEVAADVVARGQEAGQIMDVEPADPNLTASDVPGAVAAAGYPPADAVRLLYASSDGADVDRGTGDRSTLTAVRSGDGYVVGWQVTADDGSTTASSVVTVGADAVDQRMLLRAGIDAGNDLVAIWDPLGTLGTVTINGREAIMPLTAELRWFPVPAGADVVVDGVPVVLAGPSSPSYLLPGEVRDGPLPLYGS